MSRPSRSAVRAGAQAECLPVDEVTSAGPATDGSWKAHLVWLRRAISRRFGADAADDLSQEAWLRVVERASGAPVRNVRGLLMTVATNLARDRFRRRQVRDDYAAQVAAAESEPTRSVEEDLQIKQAIMALPADLRDTLLLSKIGGLTNREIAQRCGLSVRAIDKRLQKAITLFVAQLRD